MQTNAFMRKAGDYLCRIAINLISKRTWVLAVASCALWDGLISEGSWMVIATIYLSDKVASGILAQRIALKPTDPTPAEG